MTTQTAQRQGPWERWKNISHHARAARADRRLFLASALIAIAYNVIGALDVVSTAAGIQAQMGVESNPLIRLFMDLMDNGWVIAKLSLQLLASAMILWFPHRLVLFMFSIAALLTAITVWNNMQIAGMI